MKGLLSGYATLTRPTHCALDERQFLELSESL